MTSDEDLNALAPVGPPAWLFLTDKQTERHEVLSLLSMVDKSSSVVFAPLLVDLTVDRDFVPSVRTPFSAYDGGVLTKVTSYCPFAVYFYNTDDIVSYCEDHGDVARLCANTRAVFDMQTYVPEEGRRDTDMQRLCVSLGLDPGKVTGHVVFCNAVKEFLFAGQLVPCVEDAANVQIGGLDAVKVPLYPPTLFGNSSGDDGEASEDICLERRSSFVNERGLYSCALSEALFYFMFSAWGQVLRFQDTRFLIEAGMRQFVNDNQHTVKLAPRKRYHGYMSQKLNSHEKDQLMMSDAVCCELGFSQASSYLDSAYESGPMMVFTEWPIVKRASDHRDLMQKLTEFKLHLSTHVAAQVFSSNSVLYQNRMVFLCAANKVPSGGSAQDGLLRAVQFFNGLTGAYEDSYNDSKKVVKFGGTGTRDERYGPTHLAWACATSPHVVSEVVWYLNRVAVYSTGVTGGNDVCNHIVNCAAGICEACGGRCCHTCYGTAFVRASSRFPSLPKQPRKEPFVTTMCSRYMSDVDVLGSFGKRYNNDIKDGMPGGQDRKSEDASGGPSRPGGQVDRVKYMTQILDYCKKHCLIDVNTGEDALSVRGKTDFVSTLSALNKHIDDLAISFVSEARMKLTRDEIASATQAFNLDMNPFSMAFSPLMTFQYYKSLLLVIQNLALVSATSYVVDNPLTGSQISRWLNQHFQSICGAFTGISARKGFLFTRDVKCGKSVEFERLPDFRLYADTGKFTKVSMEAKLCRLSVSSLRSCRIKNRPISRVKSAGGGGSVFFKRDVVRRKNPMKGCLAFLLYRHHDKLFPNCGMSCLAFWQKVCCNAVPKTVDVGKIDEFNALLKFVISVTGEYGDQDLIDVQPDNILSYVEYRFHNKFLFYYGFKDYISTMQGLTTRLTAQNHLQFPYLLGATPKFGSLAEYSVHVKKMKIEGLPAPLVSTVARESLMRSVFDNRSLVTVSFAIEKYSTANNSKDIFQFAQIGYFVGSGVERSLNSGSVGGQDYRFMRHRSVLATKLADVIIRRAGRENVLFDADIVKSRVMAALDSTDCDPEIAALCEIMEGRDGDVPQREDVLFLVDGQEQVADSIVAKMALLVERGVTDFTLESVKAALGVEHAPCAGDLGTYDLSSFFTGDGAEGSCADVSSKGFMLGDDLGEDVPAPASVKRLRL
uniref:Single-stranded DNA-binding protein n=1 Tax=Hipposideros bat herpesvirus TaxID=3141919 RepID=A0AAU7E132_9VIRU